MICVNVRETCLCLCLCFFVVLGLVIWVKGISRRKRKREKEGGKGGGCYRYGFWFGNWVILMVGKETVKEGLFLLLLLLFSFHCLYDISSRLLSSVLLGLSTPLLQLARYFILFLHSSPCLGPWHSVLHVGNHNNNTIIFFLF